MPLIPKTKNSNITKGWIDASFEFLNGTNSNSGAMMSLFNVPLYIKYSKNHIKTNISTIAKMVILKNHIPEALCPRNFLRSQVI